MNQINIFYAFNQIHFISKLFGLALYEIVQKINNRNIIKRRNAFITIVQKILYMPYLIIYMWIIYTNHINDAIFIIAQLCLSQVTFYISLITNLVNTNKLYKNILNIIISIHQFDSNHFNKENSIFYRMLRQIFIIILAIKIFWFTFISYLLFKYIIDNIDTLGGIILCQLTFIVDSVVECQVLFILFIIKLKLKKIAVTILQYQYNRNGVYSHVKKIILEYRFYQDLSKNIENAFNAHVISKFLLNFSMCVFTAFFALQLYKVSRNSEEAKAILIIMPMWAIVTFIQSAAIILLCEDVLHEVIKFSLLATLNAACEVRRAHLIF